jgi:hypothetical protein
LRVVPLVRAFRLNLLLLKPGEFVLHKPRRIIDLWWRGAGNGSLMALLAYLMSLDRTWQNARIRIFRAVTDPAAEAEARQHLRALIDHARIQAEAIVFQTTEGPARFIAEHSAGVADLVMLGLSDPALGGLAEYLTNMQETFARLPTTLLVRSNGEADLFA